MIFFSFGNIEKHVGSSSLNQGSNPQPLHWKCGVVTTGLPGKSHVASTLALLQSMLQNCQWYFTSENEKHFIGSLLSIGNKIKSPVLSHGNNSSSFLFCPLHSSYAGLPSVSDVCPAFSVLESLTLLISFIAHLFIPARMHATQGQKLTVFRP